ncbi:hypothetical protein C8J57DRAFT_1466013 [Mycena rebaudengoi]|nr:hypothetical protein C8J57DRAFT_1466013 [Mycena rebaudengoi]
MEPSATLKNTIQYTVLAATTVQKIAVSTGVPFLASTAALTLSILEYVQLYSTSEITGVLPTALLYDIAKFTETLQKIYTFLKGRQGLGKLKQLFKQQDSALILETCKYELKSAVETFKIRAAGSTLSQMAQVQKESREQHVELLALLAAYPDLTDSDSTSVNGTLSSSGRSSESILILPPPPQIFHGRESALACVVNTLTGETARIAILGTGGMGKTTLAIAALHNPDVAAKFSHRFFIPCQSSPSCSELVSTIGSYIGLEKGRNLGKLVVKHFMDAPPSLLVLDNLETPWESSSSRSEVEEFLSLITDIPHLALMITMRGAQRPAKVKWTRPFLPPLNPISETAALQIFFDIADDGHPEDGVKDLLSLTGNLPLAVSLIASVASHEGCDNTLARWKSENTHMLSDGYDQRSSLDISIMLSFTSSRMTQGAQELLGILSMLPDGLTDADLVEAKLPISNIMSSRTTLLQTALAFVDKDKRLKVLVPIREYILRIHPPSHALKLQLRLHLHAILDLWNSFHVLNLAQIVSQISQNLGNFNSVLLDGLTTSGPDFVQSWQDEPIFGDYLIQWFETADRLPLIDAEKQVIMGNQYFQSQSLLQQARWHYALGVYYYGQKNVASALENHNRTVSLSDRTGSLNLVGQESLCNIANIMFNTGDTVAAQEFSTRALEYAVHIGDIYAQARSLYIQSKCQTVFSHYQQSRILLRNGRELLKSCGLQGCSLDMILANQEAEILLLKTQYIESRQIQVAIASTLQPTSYYAILTNLNIASIDIAIGLDSRLVRENLDTCRLAGKTLHGLYQTHLDLVSNTHDAELSLQDGDHTTASAIFSKVFASCCDLNIMEQALCCLEKLADLSTCMNSVENTLGWAGMFLGMALKAKDKLAMMKALFCFGQIFFSQGDWDTALNLFNIALDGFTFMDIHRLRGECMIHIANILEHRGELIKSLGLWKMARSLFVLSSQARDITKIDEKISTVDPLVLAEFESQLQPAEVNMSMEEEHNRDSELKVLVTSIPVHRDIISGKIHM